MNFSKWTLVKIDLSVLLFVMALTIFCTVPAYSKTISPEQARKILGVSEDASSKEIESAYRKLAKKNHPDLNHGPGAEEKFKQINEAVRVLRGTEGGRNYLSPESKTLVRFSSLAKRYDRYSGVNVGLSYSIGIGYLSSDEVAELDAADKILRRLVDGYFLNEESLAPSHTSSQLSRNFTYSLDDVLKAFGNLKTEYLTHSRYHDSFYVGHLHEFLFFMISNIIADHADQGYSPATDDLLSAIIRETDTDREMSRIVITRVFFFGRDAREPKVDYIAKFPKSITEAYLRISDLQWDYSAQILQPNLFSKENILSHLEFFSALLQKKSTLKIWEKIEAEIGPFKTCNDLLGNLSWR
jgi:hypothetical protein